MVLRRLTVVVVGIWSVAGLAFAGGIPASPAKIRQTWASQGTQYAETDSLAACPTREGKVLVFATSKKGHRLDVFDAQDGSFVQHVGELGTKPGEFFRPNGIVAVKFPKQERWMVVVVERDNARVQALWVDGFKPAGIFGRCDLTRPYGCAVSYRGDEVYLYVTDTEVPAELTVRVYRLRLEGDVLHAEHVRAFGDREGPGAVSIPESILVDDRLGRVLVCNEDRQGRHDVKVYTPTGQFTGKSFGADHLEGDPEGIVLCDQPGNGRIILTDQRKQITIWHVFDREGYRYIGSFTGEPGIANTDGICLYTRPFGPFSEGAMFAVNNDADVRAYPLNAVYGLFGTPGIKSASSSAP